uniref:Uncharacterized protein n=1 Tax=Anguilla anguilla TaxID=7936 RepID=A0A0E9S3M9_ANGAN
MSSRTNGEGYSVSATLNYFCMLTRYLFYGGLIMRWAM